MSLKAIRQLHADLEKSVQKDGGQIVGDGNAAVFNAILTEAKKAHPDDAILTALTFARGRNTLIRELHVMTGQLKVALEDKSDEPPIMMTSV